MRWSFRNKLMLAFLLFSLVPSLILTVVSSQATDLLKDRAARLVYRARRPRKALTDRPWRRPGGQDPIVDPKDLGPTEEFFDTVIKPRWQSPRRLARDPTDDRRPAGPGGRTGIARGSATSSPGLFSVIRRREDRPIFNIDEGLAGLGGRRRRPHLADREGGRAPPYSTWSGGPAEGRVRRREHPPGILGVFAGVPGGDPAARPLAGAGLVRPLAEVGDVTRNLGPGTWTCDRTSRRNDEIGDLSEQVNTVVDHLGGVIREIGPATASVSAASNELSASAQELSQGATEQASTLQEIASSLQTVDASVKSNAAHAQQTARTAREASAGPRKAAGPCRRPWPPCGRSPRGSRSSRTSPIRPTCSP